MDETSVKLCPPPVRKGWAVGDRRGVLQLGGDSSLTRRRSAVTLVSFLCDDQDIQPLLPHIFLSNEHVLSAADVEELNSSSDPRFLFSRRRSSWVNSSVLVEILEVLTVCLSEIMTTRRIILCMDTLGHICTRVLFGRAPGLGSCCFIYRHP